MASYLSQSPKILTDKILSGRAAIGRDTLARTLSTDGSVYSTKDNINVEEEKREIDSLRDFDQRLK